MSKDIFHADIHDTITFGQEVGFPSPYSGQSNNSLNARQVIGISLGAAGLFFVLIGLAAYLCLRNRRRTAEEREDQGKHESEQQRQDVQPVPHFGSEKVEIRNIPTVDGRVSGGPNDSPPAYEDHTAVYQRDPYDTVLLTAPVCNGFRI